MFCLYMNQFFFEFIKISSDIEIESDIDGDQSDDLPVEIKVLGNHIEIYSYPIEEE